MRTQEAIPSTNGLRRGISKLEVVVVILVVLLLAAILFPFIVRSRDSSRVVQCQQNLKQLGTALHAYHNSYRSFPPAAEWSTTELQSLSLDLSTRPDLFTHSNWAIMLLPYLGKEALAQSMNKNLQIAAEQNSQIRMTTLPLMSCPSDNFNRKDNPHIFEPASGLSIAFARGNYAINGGTHNMRTEPGSTSIPTGDGVHLNVNKDTREFQYWGNGIAGFNVTFSLDDFKNGTSTLVALEEVRAGIHPFDPRGVWAFGQIGGSVTWAHGVNGDDYGPNNQWPRSDDILGCARLHDTVGTDTLTREEMPCVSYLDNNTNATARSRHSGGANVLFLDGASRFISNHIDPGLWHAMHSRETPSEAFEDDLFEARLSTENFDTENEIQFLKGRTSTTPELASEISNSLDMKFTLIPAGTFTMGIPDIGNSNEIPIQSPSHTVRITQPFFLGCYEVTQKQYNDVMGNNPSYHRNKKTDSPQTDQFPVEQVTWFDAAIFCKKLSELPSEKKSGRRYRLPTEAEWEYACRAGSEKPYHWKSLRTEDDDSGEAAGISPPLPITPVGHYRANKFGLFDMRGNVWEWCADWFDRDYYTRSPVNDPQGPNHGYIKVIRGGDWRYVGEGCKIDYSMMPPWNANRFVGFRVICEFHQ